MKKLIFALLFAVNHLGFCQSPNKIKHTTKANETLYSLLKRYANSEAEFTKNNPNFNLKAPLKLGAEVFFTKATSEPNKVNKNDGKKHLVLAGETIFSICKKYDIDISDFVEANNISNNIIKPGQQMLVERGTLKQKALEIEKIIGPELIQKTEGQKVTEQGLAEVIETKNKTTKLLALHKSAPKGTILKVTNEANGSAIFAKVIGSFSKKGPDEKLMIKLSPFAYYKLKPMDSKLRAKVEYYKL